MLPLPNLEKYIRTHLRHNVSVNLLDGALFGLALGFASFSTIIPLFVTQLTDSAILIGLAPALHAIGWQLPQLFNAGQIARAREYKPIVLRNTIHERTPFLVLAIIMKWCTAFGYLSVSVPPKTPLGRYRLSWYSVSFPTGLIG